LVADRGGADPCSGYDPFVLTRHSRSTDFRSAIDANLQPTRRWSDLTDDPNDPIVIARRADTLRLAWRAPIADRAEFILERSAGRRVLDVGCVAHDVGRMASPGWLHARVAKAASECVGVDVLQAGVEHMRELGYTAVIHDASTGAGPLAELGPFDVIVAGELIEHVVSVDMLFRLAVEVLAEDGELIVTSPNPWAPHRVRAGQLGIAWENCDHILLAFPSGIAELAERHGMVLAEAFTVDDPGPGGFIARAKQLRRILAGRQWKTVGISSIGARIERRVGATWATRLARRAFFGRRRFLGETFVYVVRRTSITSS
jgi:2-polyprenyl-3-methyl-5-hydroxy-6-metoxy-1,4-benzoquinol methylase